MIKVHKCFWVHFTEKKLHYSEDIFFIEIVMFTTLKNVWNDSKYLFSFDFFDIFFSILWRELYKLILTTKFRFLEEYDKHKVSFWAISTGNEPLNGVIPIMQFNSLGWTPTDQVITSQC